MYQQTPNARKYTMAEIGFFETRWHPHTIKHISSLRNRSYNCDILKVLLIAE